MMNTDLEQLISAGNLEPLQDPFDWGRAERELQTRIPRDFRDLIDAGGIGVWFNHIGLYAPDTRYQNQNLLRSAGRFGDLEQFWEDGDEVPPPDLADGARLIAWADTPVGEVLYWEVQDSTPPEKYPIYLGHPDGEEWRRFDMQTTEFLAAIARGDLPSPLFSEDAYLHLDEPFQPYTFV
ncbi:hypothetical protein [Promicromonospora soli]